MSGIREVIRRFGMPDAISWPGFWVTFLSALIGNFVTNSSPVALPLRIAILFIGSLALWGILLTGRALFFRDPQRSRPVVMLIFLSIGVVVRAVLVAALFDLAFGPSEAKLGTRLLGAVINTGLAFVLTANVVGTFRDRRRQISTLQSQRLRMDSAIGQVTSGIDEQNEQTIERVRTVLVRELNALEGASADESLAMLQATAGDVVRPMSHELANAVPRVEPHAVETEPTAVSWSEVIDQAATGRPFSPWIVALLIGIESLGATLHDPKGAGVFGLLLAIVVVMFGIANRVLVRLLQGKRLRARISLVVFTSIICGVVLAAVEIAMRGTASVNLAIGIALGIFTTTFSLGTAVVRALGRDRDRVIAELEESSRELEHGLVRLRQMQWFHQKALSRALHGPIQSAVTAAAIRLDASIREGTVQPGVVESVRGELLEGLDVLHEADAEVTTLELGLERMTITYAGLCEIESSVSPAADSVIAADGVLRSCVIDIVTEAVSNAVWHGKANQARIEVSLDPQAADVLLIEVSSNGRGSADSQRRGLGSQQLDDWTLAWSREIGEQGTMLTAALPVAALPV